MGKAARRKSRAARNPRVQVAAHATGSDWSPAIGLDVSKLESGSYKFAGPEDQRALDRTSQRELGRISVALRLPAAEAWIQVQLWDFTSIGFGVVYRPECDPRAPALSEPLLSRLESTLGATGIPGPNRPDKLPLKEGDEIELKIRIRSRSEFTIWCQVRNMGPSRDGVKIGLRRLDIGFPQPVDVNRRASTRLTLSPTLSLQARVKHPFLFGHRCLLSVSDLNRDLGISFISKDPSILVFEGMELEINFELPAFRREPMRVRVVWVHATAPEAVRFGAVCVTVDLPLHNALCDYLLFSQLWTPARLREAGFQSKRVKGHLRFTTVKTMDDYSEVLYLRRDSYVGVGKRPPGTRPERMSSPLDGKSRIIMAKHHGHLVGTLTFTFPSSEDTLLDTQAGFTGNRYPVHLPPKANLIEVSRLCIDENYRGTDVLVGMFENGIKHFLLSDRHWMLTSATDELLPLYQRIGFVRLKASYKHPLLNQQVHHLIIAHRSSFLWGFGISNIVWNTVFGDLIDYLVKRRLLELPAWTRAIIWTKRLLRPLAGRLLDSKARSAFRKHMDAIQKRRRQELGNQHDLLLKEDAVTESPDSLYSHVEVEVPDPGKPEAEASGRD